MTFIPDVSAIAKASVKAAAKATVKGVHLSTTTHSGPTNSTWQPAPPNDGGGGGWQAHIHCSGDAGVHYDPSHGWGGHVDGQCNW